MTRTVTTTINYARVAPTLSGKIDTKNQVATLSLGYICGERINGEYHDVPAMTQVGTVEIALGFNDNPGQRFGALIATICAQEGLDLSAGDEVLLP